MPTVEELWARMRDDPEATKELAARRAQFIAFAGPGTEGERFVAALLARIAEAFPEFVPASTPEAMFDQIVGGLFEMLALVAPWWDKQPSAVAKAGLVVPLSQMSPPEIAVLFRAHREGGDDATIEFVRRAYDRLFGSPDFLARLKEQWRADAFLARRIAPLSDALGAHAAGLFGASIPTLLAQLEGLIADVSAHRGRMREAKWREYMDAVAGKDPFVGGLVQVFVGEVLMARFGHGSDVPSPLSRHAILHGGDLSYGSEIGSRTAILLVDYFAFVARIQRELGANIESDVANQVNIANDAAGAKENAAAHAPSGPSGDATPPVDTDPPKARVRRPRRAR